MPQEPARTEKQMQMAVSFKYENSPPYLKIDQSKACKIGADFSINFFQYDYLKIATYAETAQDQPLVVELAPISRVVMNEETFSNLVRELVRMAKALGVNWEAVDGQQ